MRGKLLYFSCVEFYILWKTRVFVKNCFSGKHNLKESLRSRSEAACGSKDVDCKHNTSRNLFFFLKSCQASGLYLSKHSHCPRLLTF